ncbi:hypothetical protein [Streptomyces sp. TLI_185]|uniref:hypothetical protein n=1 Tax=Streptomyces sp. TLI_185 TaxID=2485151 RepID=UPI000F51658B|nr:hypothetical protein [Streptomyces sp. TLI_185]RPF30262.1 hypothetical protein EDD92_0010 [Streptomyces sp. TLI_185]
MSDRSALQLYVYAMPAKDRTAVQLGIDDNCLEPYDGSSSGIVPGMRYRTEQVPVGSAHDLAVHLLTNAPGTAFELWQDPVFEHPGHYVAHLPGIGSYEGVCDSYGVPLVKLTEVLDAPSGAREGTSGLREDHFTRHAPFFASLRRVQRARRP